MTQPPKRVEDYTDICLLFLWVNLLWMFSIIWWVLGLIYVLILSYYLNRLISRFAAMRRPDPNNHGPALR